MGDLLPIITEIKTREEFVGLLARNPGQFIIKFGAEWCGPCKKMSDLFHSWVEKMPNNVQVAILDVDESFEIYAYLKSKKMVNGVPVILCYQKGNLNFIPDDVVIGADHGQINLFFQRCLSKL